MLVPLDKSTGKRLKPKDEEVHPWSDEARKADMDAYLKREFGDSKAVKKRIKRKQKLGS